MAVTSIVVYSSITNTLGDEKRDINKPFSFLEFLNYANILTKNISELALYQQYLKAWQGITNIKLESINADIREQFIAFLEEVKLKFLKGEENRYFDNINLHNNEQLTIAIPFFSTKIKEIALYFKLKRQHHTKSLNFIKVKGSDKGMVQFIEDQIVDLYSGDDIPPELAAPENLNEFLNNIEISVESIYDTFNDYYDLDPTKSPTFYDTTSGNRFDFFTSNTNPISADYFIDQDQVINDIINGQDISIIEIPGLLATTDSTDTDKVEGINFTEYSNTGDRDDLKFMLDIELIENFMGVDMYYLSSNEMGEYTKAKLFDAASPYRNLLNVNNPATLSIPGNNFKSERSVGKFFKPSNQGMLKMEASFSSTLIEENIAPNTVYIFPDPDQYGSVLGVGGSARANPLLFTPDNSEFKNASSSFGQPLPKSNHRDQNFYAYSSIEQRNFKQNNTESFINIETMNLSGSIIREEGDIFGNVFYAIDANDYYNRNLDNFTPVSTPLDLYGSTTEDIPTSITKKSISEIRGGTKQVEVYNIIHDRISPLPTEFTSLFDRYISKPDLYNELTSNAYRDLYIFKNTIFLKTESFLLIDNFLYTEDGNFIPDTFNSNVKGYNTDTVIAQLDGNQISNISKPVRLSDDVFYVKVSSDPSSTSPVNLKFFEFSIFKYDLTKRQDINLVSSRTQNQSFFNSNFTFDVGSNITSVNDVSLSYNSKQAQFLCTTNFNDLNNTKFIHVLIFKIIGNEISIIQNYVITPDNFYGTQNFYSVSVLADNFLIQTQVTTPTQDSNNGTINF